MILSSFLRCNYIAIAAHLVAVVAVDEVAASVAVEDAAVELYYSEELDSAVVLELDDELLDELDDPS